ncbi:sprT-like domain-containing protein Spartan isoform X1 [Dinothrombium tinctorium]|uniref:SprT-like domain-containing protein Spartan isoform X1 n=1 Tax=Dinothrombium tinctorium TaxID=1965070 RepID=A0A3S3SLZ1_9ACAR|nr:sprT-like domain-containing protein Spartan isoform X1 [Dinothrombium tinctorium]
MNEKSEDSNDDLISSFFCNKEDDDLISSFTVRTDEYKDIDYALALSLQEFEDSQCFFNYEENDLLFAHELQKHLNHSETVRDPLANDCFVVSGKRYQSLVDPELEVKDPHPNIWHLFRDFDKHFFRGVLTSKCVQVEWSKRMTSCAGICEWRSFGLCTIRLSEPLLTLRSRSDLIETLLHEMIHAYLFVIGDRDNHESHGPKFHYHMYRINKEAKTNITVYHTFHDEVKYYQKHVWRCDGPCSKRPPYFGYIRRSMNRKPGPYDFWWKDHVSSCGGTFIKLSEPENFDKKKNPKKHTATIATSSTSTAKVNDIRTHFTKDGRDDESKKKSQFVPFSGKGFILGNSSVSTRNKTQINNQHNVSNGSSNSASILPKKRKLEQYIEINID